MRKGSEIYETEINVAETLRKAKHSGGMYHVHTHTHTHTRHTLQPTLKFSKYFLYKELSDSPSIPYPVTGKYSILPKSIDITTQLHCINHFCYCYYALMYLSDGAGKALRCFTAPNTTCHTSVTHQQYPWVILDQPVDAITNKYINFCQIYYTLLHYTFVRLQCNRFSSPSVSLHADLLPVTYLLHSHYCPLQSAKQ
jgi:hypothetical protein